MNVDYVQHPGVISALTFFCSQENTQVSQGKLDSCILHMDAGVELGLIKTAASVQLSDKCGSIEVNGAQTTSVHLHDCKGV